MSETPTRDACAELDLARIAGHGGGWRLDHLFTSAELCPGAGRPSGRAPGPAYAGEVFRCLWT